MSKETNGKEFDKMERIVVKVLVAEVGNLDLKEMGKYRESTKNEDDSYSFMDFVRDVSIAKGREEKCKEMVIKLKAENVSLSIIAKATGLSIEEIASL